MVSEKPQLELDITDGINKKNNEVVGLTSKVRKLEEELLKLKDENEKLRSQWQVHQSNGSIKGVSEVDENIERVADAQVGVICGKSITLVYMSNQDV